MKPHPEYRSDTQASVVFSSAFYVHSHGLATRFWMGRGHYFGGSTIIYLDEEGTRFSTKDESDAVRGGDSHGKSRRSAPKPNHESRFSLLNYALDAEVQARVEVRIPKSTPAWLIEEVRKAQGLDRWAKAQPRYRSSSSRRRTRAAARKVDATERTGVESTPVAGRPATKPAPAGPHRRSVRETREAQAV